MMSTALKVTGFGYLTTVLEQTQEIIVDIGCFNAHKQDEILYLSCIVKDPALFDRLKNYQATLSSGHAITLKFSADYLETTQFQSCWAEGVDPGHIVNMKAKLTAINTIYVDGVKHYAV
jgi:hypothetical protein